MRKHTIHLDNKLLNLNQANCVEIAIAYCLSNINPIYARHFLFYLKALQCYCVDKAKGNKILYPVELDEELCDILKLLSINVIQYKNCNLDQNFIDTALDKKKFVFLSVDSSKLFYSDYYLKKANRHAIVICKREDAQKRYQIIDNTQCLANKKLYDLFFLPYPIIHQMFSSYQQSFHMSYFGILEKQNPKFEKRMLYKSLIEVLKKSDVNEWERIFFMKMDGKFYDGSEETSQIIEQVIQLGNHKKMFYQLASDISFDNNISEVKYNLLQEQIKVTFQEYDQAMQSLLLGYMKNHLPALENRMQLYLQEKKLKNMLCSIMERW